MLYAAVPAEISHVPANPADTDHRILDQVDSHAAAFQHPQAAAGQQGKHQRTPFPPSVVDQRKQEKTDNKIELFCKTHNLVELTIEEFIENTKYLPLQ